jgi:hypothetical protein
MTPNSELAVDLSHLLRRNYYYFVGRDPCQPFLDRDK